LKEKIFNFAPVEKKTTGEVSLEQVLLLEKIFNFAPVEKKNHRSSFTGAGTVARENI